MLQALVVGKVAFCIFKLHVDESYEIEFCLVFCWSLFRLSYCIYLIFLGASLMLRLTMLLSMLMGRQDNGAGL